MKEKIAVRAYEVLVAPDHYADCQTTHDLFLRGSAMMLEFWTDLMGGFQPKFLPEKVRQIKNSDLVAAEGQKKNQDMVASAQAHCFTVWFHPTRNRKVRGIAMTDVIPRFTRYWRAGGGENYLDEGLRHLFAAKQPEDVFWVDCRERFLNMGIPQEQTAYLHGEWPLYQSNEDVMRSLQCKMWPQNKQTNYYSLLTFYEWLERWIPTQLGQPWNKVAAEVADVYETSVNKKPGRHPGWQKQFVANAKLKTKLSAEDVESLVATVQNNKTRSAKESMFVVHPWMEKARKTLEQRLGIPYEGNFDVWGEMTTLAFARFLSWRTNFQRQLGVRIKYANTYTAAKAKRDADVPGWLLKVLTDHKRRTEKPQEYVTARQLTGFHELFELLADDKSPAVIETLAKTRPDRFGDRELFRSIVGGMGDTPPDKVCSFLETVLDCETAENKYLNLRQPPLTWVDENNPAHPWFGNSKPFGQVAVSDRPGEQGFVIMNLFKQNEFERTKLGIWGRRFFKEIHHGEGHKAARDHKLIRAMTGEKKIRSSVPADKISIQLLPRAGRWYLKLAPKLPCPTTPSIKDMKEEILSGEEVPVLSVDRGFRNPLAYSVLVFNKKGFTLRNEGKVGDIRFGQIECGSLLEQQQIGKGRKVFCRLAGSRHKPNEEQLALWKAVNKRPWTPPWLETDHLKMTEAIAEGVLSKVQVSLARNKFDDALDWLNRGLSVVLGARGALTLEHMNSLRSLISAAQAIRKVHEEFTNGNRTFDPPITLPPNHEWLIDTLQKRLRNVRREAVRVSVSLILLKSIEVGAKIIVVEDLDMGPTTRESRQRNRRMTDWCNRWLVRELKMQAPLYGRFIKGVSPVATSMQDFSVSGDFWKPKFTKKTADDLANFRDTLAKQLKFSAKHGARAITIRGLWEMKASQYEVPCTVKDLMGVLREEVKKTGQVYVPSFYGEHYYASECGWVDSDVSAAAMIGKRGIRNLLGWYARESIGVETPDADEKQRNSLVHKVKKMFEALRQRSRDANYYLPRSWAASE